MFVALYYIPSSVTAQMYLSFFVVGGEERVMGKYWLLTAFACFVTIWKFIRFILNEQEYDCRGVHRVTDLETIPVRTSKDVALPESCNCY